MSKPSMKEKAKKFINNHKTEILAVATLVATAVVVINNFDKAKQAETKRRDADTLWTTRENNWLDDQYSNGKKVYFLHDKTYVTMPIDTPTEWIQDRPKRP